MTPGLLRKQQSDVGSSSPLTLLRKQSVANLSPGGRKKSMERDGSASNLLKNGDGRVKRIFSHQQSMHQAGWVGEEFKDLEVHMKPSRPLTPIINKIIQETFEMIDRGGAGFVEAQSILVICRVIGVDPDTAVSKRACGDTVNLKEVVAIISGLMDNDLWCTQEVTDAYDVFDKSFSANLNHTNAKKLLLRIRENLTETEIESQIKDMTSSHGEANVSYINQSKFYKAVYNDLLVETPIER